MSLVSHITEYIADSIVSNLVGSSSAYSEYALRISAEYPSVYGHKEKPLDQFLSHSRAGDATYIDESGNMQVAGPDELRYEYEDGLRYLVLENLSTNLITNSLASAENWTSSGATIVNQALNAMGRFSGLSIGSNGNIANGAIVSSVTVTSGTAYYFSYYYRAGTGNKLRIVMYNPATATESRIEGTIGSTLTVGSSAVGAIIVDSEKIYPNGLDRKLIIKYTPNFTGTVFMGVGPNSANIGDNIIALAAQFETVSPTSYIPTSGSAVTRPVDMAEVDISELNLSSGYAAFICFNLMSLAGTSDRVVQFDSGTNIDRQMLFYSASSGFFSLQVVAGGTQVALINAPALGGLRVKQKIAFNVVTDNTTAYYNGNSGFTDQNCLIVTPSFLRLASQSSGANKPSRILINDIIIYDTELSNEELEEITLP